MSQEIIIKLPIEPLYPAEDGPFSPLPNKAVSGNPVYQSNPGKDILMPDVTPTTDNTYKH